MSQKEGRCATRNGPEAEEHHRDRNDLLPVHAQTTFLLGMAQTNMGTAVEN